MQERSLPQALRNPQLTVRSFHLKRKPDTRRKDLPLLIRRLPEKQGKLLA
jgi:hypothetical protein